MAKKEEEEKQVSAVLQTWGSRKKGKDEPKLAPENTKLHMFIHSFTS